MPNWIQPHREVHGEISSWTISPVTKLWVVHILYTWTSERSQKIRLASGILEYFLMAFHICFMWWLPKRPDDCWKYQAKREVREGTRLWSLVFWGLASRGWNWIDLHTKNWIEYQAKCQIQEKNYKPVNTIIIQKNSNGFHSTGLSVSHFGFFTSAKEQKWKPREGSVSLWVFIWQRGKPGTCRSMWGIDAFKTHRKNYQD